MKKILGSIIAIVGLAGCADMPPKYQPPKLAPEAAATLVGSKVVNEEFFGGSARVSVTDIDGTRAIHTVYDFDTPEVLAPGTHRIRYLVSVKSLSEDSWGAGEVQITVEAGKHYVIRSTKPKASSRVCKNATTWVEETGTAQRVSQDVDVVVVTWTGATVPVGGGGFVSLPSRTRCPESPHN